MEGQSLSPNRSVGERVVAFGGNRASHRSQQQQVSNGGSDSLPPFLQPECLLPVQYNALVRKHAVEGGERRLLLAVLKDALRSYLKNMHGRTAHARHDFEEIYYWFHAQDQEGIFAYEHLCDALGIHPEPLRRWLGTLHNGGGPARRRTFARY